MDVVGTQQSAPLAAHHHHHSNNRRPARSQPYGHYRVPAVEKYAYCLCLHVKPTTIFIAVFKFIRALLFASILLNSEFQPPSDQELDMYYHNEMNEEHRSMAVAVSILLRVIMASASAFAIYAVTSGRATLLMPLYSLLLIDFFFALPSFYNKNLDPQFPDGGLSDIRNYPLSNTDQYNRYSVFTLSALGMIAKVYFLCVIWKCYRYLRLTELVSEMYAQMPSHLARVVLEGANDPRDMDANHSLAPPPYESIASSMKPPNYEEAMKTCPNVYTINLPPYEATAQLPTYSALVPRSNNPSSTITPPSQTLAVESLPNNSILNLGPATSRAAGRIVVEVAHQSMNSQQKNRPMHDNRAETLQPTGHDTEDHSDQSRDSTHIEISETSGVLKNGKTE